MKRTTSLAAAVAAAAIIATPVAGTSAAVTAPAPAAAVVNAAQAPTLPPVESFAPDPLKVLALPFSNFELIRTSAFVITGYVNKSDGKPVRAKGEGEGNANETDSQYAAWLRLNAKPVEVNIFQAISDSVNKVALKGDFATAAAQIQNYLSQLAAQVIALPTALINHNVDAFFPKPVPSPTATAQRAAAPVAAANPFALPDAGALLTLAGVPLKNFDQARLATFVTTGYETNKAGEFVGKDGKPLKEGQTKEKDGVPITANIFQAVSDAVNKKALKGDFAGAATAIQGYFTELAGNVVKLPGEILTYDLQAISAVVPGVPTLSEDKPDTGSAKTTSKDLSPRTTLVRTSSAQVGDSANEAGAGVGDSVGQAGAPGAGTGGAPAGSSEPKEGPDLIEKVRDLFDRPDKSGPAKDKEASPEPEAPETESNVPSDEGAGAEASGDGAK
ncbi:hypothetical protein [Tsukamurella pseudospumae]|uniref:Uncharacterized protein n=1 Tax=Tsukamurella pseudospumae TaxID=239498 RepID=A0A137ZZX6_9ACTN|nr:hypothetical protein [Tsukamurella pseudospumae]KXP03746.1 hypothetical protein AXK60_18305 [Tsukamurella pseudospumae]